MAHVMLNDKKLSERLWTEVVNTAYHTINHVYFRPGTKKTLYELWKGKKPNVSYFHIFGSTCYIFSYREYLGKLDSKSDIGIFLSYTNNNKAYRVYNMITQTVMELVNVVVDDFFYFFIFLSF